MGLLPGKTALTFQKRVSAKRKKRVVDGKGVGPTVTPTQIHPLSRDPRVGRKRGRGDVFLGVRPTKRPSFFMEMGDKNMGVEIARLSRGGLGLVPTWGVGG